MFSLEYWTTHPVEFSPLVAVVAVALAAALVIPNVTLSGA
jgi:hypothetical protein